MLRYFLSIAALGAAIAAPALGAQPTPQPGGANQANGFRATSMRPST